MASDTPTNIVVAIDGVEVPDVDDLIVSLAEARVGQTVTLTIVREGERQRVNATLEEWPAQ
jgi:S1-C subfamily serine protease